MYFQTNYGRLIQVPHLVHSRVGTYYRSNFQYDMHGNRHITYFKKHHEKVHQYSYSLLDYKTVHGHVIKWLIMSVWTMIQK